MQSQEWLERKATTLIGGKVKWVDLKDALIAIEMAHLEGCISYAKANKINPFLHEKRLTELKLKHNIPL